MLHEAIDNIKKIQSKLLELPKTKQFPKNEIYRLSSDLNQENNEHIKRCQFFINDLCNKFGKFINECNETKKNYYGLLNAIKNYKLIVENPEYIETYKEFEYLNNKYKELQLRNKNLNEFNKIQFEDSDFLNIEKQLTYDNNNLYDQEIIEFLDSKIKYDGFYTTDEITNLENILEFLVGEEKDDTTTL